MKKATSPNLFAPDEVAFIKKLIRKSSGGRSIFTSIHFPVLVGFSLIPPFNQRSKHGHGSQAVGLWRVLGEFPLPVREQLVVPNLSA
ncbi:hypothetical protein [Prevotella rectalis]|uniref:hypothetical protein n=1 Tax=Prevotella rectalis TaxID=2219999 RepID=UPI001031F83B|nr:hypothetical protein [Prevotella brunnea]